MSAPAWTPGPWRDGQDGNTRVYGPDGMGEHSGLIATVFKGRANARLIAAAPDLAEALEELLFEDSDKSEVDRVVTRVKARAALAKAHGQ